MRALLGKALIPVLLAVGLVAGAAIGAGVQHVRYEGFLWFEGAMAEQYGAGEKAAEARCDAENLSAKLAELQRQLTARDNVIAAGKIRDAEREARLQDLQDRTDGYISDIERLDAELAAADARPAAPGATIVYRNRCGGDPARAGRVRDLWRQ